MGDLGAALARAEAAVKALARDYLTWAKADLDLCHKHLAAAKNEPALREEHITALFGVAHNMKGQGSSFGYPLITRLGESLCLLTRRARAFSDVELALMTTHLELMSDILAQEASGEGSPALLAAVQKVENDVTALGIAA